MLQCFTETGEAVQDFHVRFDYDKSSQEVQHVAHVQGSEHNFARTAANVFVEEFDDPFWISATDGLYLNIGYEYSDELRCNMTASIAERCQTEMRIVSLTSHSLASLGLRLSARQAELFQNGRPLWRRSALSCNPGRGKNSRSAITERLSNSLSTWLVFNELVARKAVQVDLTRNDTKFPKLPDDNLSLHIQGFLEPALGISEGLDEGQNHNARNKYLRIGASAIGIERLGLNRTAKKLSGAFIDGRTRHFKTLFGPSRKIIGNNLLAEMTDFEHSPRRSGEEFDAYALIEWSGQILIYLRIAFAASLRLDKKCNEARKQLRKAESDDARHRVVGKFTLAWLEGIVGDETDGTKRNVDLEELLDLQIAAFIAMATGVNPHLLFPYISNGIYDTFDEETPLTSQLFMGAIWLGELFRKRSSMLDRHHAQAIVTSCNPASLPRGLPLDRLEEWVTAARLMTSFLTQIGLDRLMEVANNVLNDGVSRQIVAREPMQWQPHLPKKKRATASKPNTFEQLRCAGSLLPAPVAVEAGWLLLPGDYQNEWVGKSEPFERQG